jgi:hypothetical protein
MSDTFAKVEEVPAERLAKCRQMQDFLTIRRMQPLKPLTTVHWIQMAARIESRPYLPQSGTNEPS